MQVKRKLFNDNGKVRKGCRTVKKGMSMSVTFLQQRNQKGKIVPSGTLFDIINDFKEYKQHYFYSPNK